LLSPSTVNLPTILAKPVDVRQVAAQLNVSHVLEGSVQKAGDRVQINVQLIQADNDAHLWAQTYDRDLADVFAIQSEIAKAIRDLGGSPELVATIEGKTKEQMYRAAERLGADRHLLAAIGSWGDTMNDEDVLRHPPRLERCALGSAAAPSPHAKLMAVDLTDDERKLLVNLLTVEIEGSKFPLSARIESLKRIRAKLRGESATFKLTTHENHKPRKS